MDSSARSTVALNDRQVEVLDWIKAGCPDGVFPTDDFAHRVTARALAKRGLVEISGRGDSWSAVPTDRGRVWPRATAIDEEIRALHAKAQAVDAKVAARLKSERKASGTSPEKAPIARTVRQLTRSQMRQRRVDDLTQRVAAANGGPIVVTADWDQKWDEIQWMSLAATKSPYRPFGQTLSIRGHGGYHSGQLELSFKPYFRDMADTTPVKVPKRVSGYHPVVQAFLEDKQHQNVSKEAQPRAARTYHAIVLEAERRGLTDVTYDKGVMTFATEHGPYHFAIWEVDGRQGRHVGWDEHARLIKQGVPEWELKSTKRFQSTGKLNMRQGASLHSYGNDEFGDRKIVRLEDRLSEAFIRFDVWLLEWTHRKEQQKLEEERRERNWKSAMVRAREDYFEDARWSHFAELVDRSSSIVKQREFLVRAQEATEGLPPEKREAALTYLQQMERVIDGRDPFASPHLIVPEVPEPTKDQLRPFLNGWSPNGPHDH